MKQTEILHVHTLILGGGLTGLSVAYHLEQLGHTDYLLVEKNSFFGGLSASETKGDFTFDFSGHLLHLHHPYAISLVRRLLKGNLIRHKRQAFIDFQGQRVPFPFQANLWALPKKIRTQCLAGVQQAACVRSKKPKNLEEWFLQAFGKGIYQYFLKPYNTKLWQTKPKQMTWDWCDTFVPTPNLKQITNGAKKKSAALGYNAYFYYPRRGGCAALAEALSKHVPNTWLNASVQKIDLKKHIALINGKTVYFEKLINTLPLPHFVKTCENVPDAVYRAARQLKHTTVHVWQMAVNRKVPTFHWIYFPQPEIPFFRVGMQSAFSPNLAPKGTTSFYIESTQKITDLKQAEKAFRKALLQKGIIEKQDKIICSFWRTLSPAYAVYNFKRSTAKRHILQWLKRYNCFCAGRYGLWEYSFMERSLLQGQNLAKQILGKHS